MNENYIYSQMYHTLATVARNVVKAYDGNNSGTLSLAILQLEKQLDAYLKRVETLVSDDLRQDGSDALTTLTEEQLRHFKKQVYERAKNEGIIPNCYQIGRHLGQSLSANYGPKYTWEHDGITIYVDDYGNYMTVRANGRRVLSTHQTEHLFVPGEWVNVIDEYAPKANEARRQKEIDDAERARQRLLRDFHASDEAAQS